MGLRDWLRFGGDDGRKYDLGNFFDPGEWKKGASDAFGNILNLGDESEEAKAKRANLNRQGREASDFAALGQHNFGKLGAESGTLREQLARQARGEDSVSREMLRQGLQQNLSAQRSMAAGAAPNNQAMAARTAAMQMGRMGAGMSGQAAIAGLQEKKDAQGLLGQMLMQQRQQELAAALGSRGNAITAFGGGDTGKTGLEKAQPAINSLAAIASLFSDRRLKADIEDGDDDANEAIDGVKAYRFKYRDEKHGKGRQLGVMAQDLEKAGLGHAVIETAEGKAVDPGKLSGANTALIAALGRRVAKLEGANDGATVLSRKLAARASRNG